MPNNSSRKTTGDDTTHPAAVWALHAKGDGSETNKQYRQTLRDNFARRLVALIRQAGLTQAELARKAGMERYHVTDYVTARRYPRPAQLAALAEALGVSPDDLRPRAPGASEPPKLPRFGIVADERNPGKMRVQLDETVSLETALKIGELLKDERDAAADGS
jgi:transcriptional regulator with XRE-family HTH domain